jgi:hypothetical protein
MPKILALLAVALVGCSAPRTSSEPAPAPLCCEAPAQRVGGTIGEALAVATAGAAPPGAIISATADPNSGGLHVHVVGQGPTSQLVTWKLTATSTPQQLASMWATSKTIATGQAVVVTGSNEFCVATTGGTTADAGTGPSVANAGVGDGTVTWHCYALTKFMNGITAYDSDLSTSIFVGGSSDELFLTIPANYGTLAIPVADPTATWFVSGNDAGTPVLTLVGLP